MNDRYWLTPHVHVRFLREGLIVLDLAQNKYLGARLREGQVLRSVVANWPQDDDLDVCGSEHASTDEVRATVESWCKAGLLTSIEPSSRVRTRPSVEELSRAVGQNALYGTVRWHHVINFAWAFARSVFALRFVRFDKVVKRVADRKQRKSATEHELDWERAEELTAVFRRLRPFAFSARGRCLLHSLVLIEFLAHYDVFPTWMLGVKARPWGAHSWVQNKNAVFDCGPDQVWEFSPILAV